MTDRPRQPVPDLGAAHRVVAERRRPRREEVLAALDAIALDPAKAKRLRERDWRRLDRRLRQAATGARHGA